MRNWVSATLVVVLGGLALHAQAPAPERRTLAVSVLDKEGKAVHGLTAENFRGTFRGQPVRILSATEDTSPRRIALLLDTSNSAREPRAFSANWAVIEDVVLKLGDKHEISFSIFAGGVERRVSFTRGVPTLQDTLSKTKAFAKLGGGTAVHDAVVGAAKQFTPPAFGDAILIVSDMVDTASSKSAEQAERILAREGVRTFIVWTEPAVFDERERARRLKWSLPVPWINPRNGFWKYLTLKATGRRTSGWPTRACWSRSTQSSSVGQAFLPAAFLCTQDDLSGADILSAILLCGSVSRPFDSAPPFRRKGGASLRVTAFGCHQPNWRRMAAIWLRWLMSCPASSVRVRFTVSLPRSWCIP